MAVQLVTREMRWRHLARLYERGPAMLCPIHSDPHNQIEPQLRHPGHHLRDSDRRDGCIFPQPTVQDPTSDLREQKKAAGTALPSSAEFREAEVATNHEKN